ncbi:NRPS [Microbotryomycetes sp. JL221]|nr:NRPS [Microbotryomycetes sp. JL221]
MGVPDFPRLPPSYVVPSTATSWNRCEAELLLRHANSRNDHTVESSTRLIIRLACCIALAQHAGQDTYSLIVDQQVIQGVLDMHLDVNTLLSHMTLLVQPTTTTTLPRLSLKIANPDSQPLPTTPLEISMTETSSSIKLQLVFDSQLLTLIEAQWFLSHVTHYANQLVQTQNNDSLESQLTLRPPSEQHLLQQYSRSPDPTQAYPDTCNTLDSFVLHAASLYPDNIAIDFAYDDDDDDDDDDDNDDTSSRLELTFSQLVLVARYVAATSIIPLLKTQSNVIPICIDKSPEMVISMLAVLLSGSAYLNLEPNFPETRKFEILEELKEYNMLSSIAIVQSTNGENQVWNRWQLLESIVNPIESMKQILDKIKAGVTDLGVFEDKIKDTEWPPVNGTDPAYVIYTSGTTGKPKGICVEHRNVEAFLRNYRGVFGRAPGERVLQFPSYSFDVSVMNIWDTWAHGATLCMTTPTQLMSDLAGTILKLSCTVVDLTPTVSSVLFEHIDSKPKNENETLKQAWLRAGFKVKWINTGGEKVEKWIRDAWFQRGVRVVIDYGPTETTVGVISNQSTDWSPIVVPIGRPTGSTPIYILSTKSLEPVPLGCIGEICVGGKQVTRGYVKQSLNEGVFVDGGQEFGRIYRTGDLGRFLGDGQGSIECLGRKDGQVKVNGLRIEIGEIEEHINSKAHQDVIRGVVDKLETPEVTASLVAFIDLSSSFKSKHTSTDQQSSTDDVHVLPCFTSTEFLEIVERLKTHLTHILPHYMVPKYWLPINRVPTQGMGKTDRKLLRQMAENFNWKQARTQMRKNNQSNETNEESKQVENKIQTKDEWFNVMRQIWSKVLRIEINEIFDQDSFTKLGGDSIGFLKVVGKLRESGYKVSFKDLVQASTLEECVQVIKQVDSTTRSSTETKDDLQQQQHDYKPFSLITETTPQNVLLELEQNFGLSRDVVEDVYPTAPSQDALLAASLDCTHYYAQAIYSLDNTISIDQVKFGLNQMIQTYSILRSCFVMLDQVGTTCQVVLKSDSNIVKQATQVEVIESDDLDLVIKEWLDKDRRNHVFDWGKLLISFSIFVCSKTNQRKLGWSMHHAMSDGWTLELLTTDLRSFCHKLNVSKRPNFSSIVSWWIKNNQIQISTSKFWKTYLEGCKPLFWPNVDALNGKQLSTSTIEFIHWEGDLVDMLRTNGITPAIATRIAIIVALSRHSQTNDVTVGIVRSGRDIDTTEFEPDQVIGPCVSVLPCRIQIQNKDETFPSLFELCQKEIQQDKLARTYQHVTLSQLSSICQLQGGRNDLFNILITYQSLAEREQDSVESNLKFPIQQPPERITMPTSYTMSFEITPSPLNKNKLELACFYDNRVIQQEKVNQVLKDVGKIMDYITMIPCTKIDQIQFETNQEKIVNQPVQILNPKPFDQGLNEKRIQEIVNQLKPVWSSVLKLETNEFDVQDSFASLGGDSISMMKLSVRLSKVNIGIPVHRLIKLATMRDQAKWVVQQQQQEQETE